MDHAVQKIHLIAVCGTGMGSLALLLKASGYKVTGSDAQVYPPMSTLLEGAGIVYHQGFGPQHLDRDTDLVVIGNAVSKENAEVREVLQRRIPYLSFPQALARFFLKDRSPIVVTGTHGKTTTAALMAWVLESAGRRPGFLIGGWPRNFNGGARAGSGPYFVVEGDEYDTAFFDKGPKFLHYPPQQAILTGIEFDHGDIFGDLAQIRSAFRAFVERIPSTGLLVAVDGSPSVDQVIEGLSCPVVRYGLGEVSAPVLNRWSARAIQFGPKGMEFEATCGGSSVGRIACSLLGRHNVQNVLAVIATAQHMDLSTEEIQTGLATFQGVKRRLEVIDVVDDIMIMDDFAHHPTAVCETLAALRAGYPGRRLWAVFEPRSATSRMKVFQEDFRRAFKGADRVVIADLYAPHRIPAEERLDPLRLVEELREAGQTAWFLPDPDAIVQAMVPQLLPGDLLCVMSSGGFGGLHSKLIEALRGERRGQAAYPADR